MLNISPGLKEMYDVSCVCCRTVNSCHMIWQSLIVCEEIMHNFWKIFFISMLAGSAKSKYELFSNH